MNADLDAVGIDFSALPFEQSVSRAKEAVEHKKRPSATCCPRRYKVQDGLVQRIAALDFNVIQLVGKGWVADQGEDEIAWSCQPSPSGMATTSYSSKAARMAVIAGSGIGSDPVGFV